MPTRILLLCSFLIASLGAAACGPYLRYPDGDVRAYRSTVRCSAGPVELAAVARGARWGEKVEVYAYTPRAIAGRYAVRVGDGKEVTGDFVTRASDGEAPLPPDNARCVLTDEEMARATATPPAPPVTPTVSAGASTAIVVPPSSSAGATVTAEGRVRVAAPPSLSQTALDGASGLRKVPIWSATFENALPYGPPPLAAGTGVHVRLFSPQPNDLDGVVLVIEHRVAAPSVSDAAWEQHLRDERRAAEQRRADAARARAEAAREHAAEAARDAAEAKRRADEDRRRREAEERRRSDEARRLADEQRRREAFCAAHHADVDCWGEGGYDAFIEMRAAVLDAEIAVRETPPDPSRPSVPPPAPLVEDAPPRPSQNADWIAGYWRWSGVAYGWIAGRWRVPTADVEAKLTVAAPAPPPPPPVERVPPPPAPGTMWTHGYWQWSGRAFVWVPGSWQVAPRLAIGWRRARWIVDGRGARFVPGAWLAAPPR